MCSLQNYGGVLEGLRLPQGKGYDRVELQVDSQEVVNAIQENINQWKGMS